MNPDVTGGRFYDDPWEADRWLHDHASPPRSKPSPTIEHVPARVR